MVKNVIKITSTVVLQALSWNGTIYLKIVDEFQSTNWIWINSRKKEMARISLNHCARMHYDRIIREPSRPLWMHRDALKYK